MIKVADTHLPST